MSRRFAARPESLFYGWVVVAAVFVITFIAFGTAYSFGALFHSLETAFGATRADVSLMFSLSGFLYFGLGAVSGPLSDRFGPRALASAGMVVLALGLVLTALSTTLEQASLAYGLGVGVGLGMAYVPSLSTIQRWFIAGRGKATGLAVSGIGAGTLVMPLVAAALTEAAGWRQGYFILAGMCLTLGVGASLLLEASPRTRGLQPDGVPAGRLEANEPSRISEIGPSLADALTSRPFWLLYAGSFLVSLGLYIPFVHLASYAQDHGLPERVGALLLGLLGIGSLLGRLCGGGMADRFGRARSLAMMYAGLAVMSVWWLFSTRFWSLACFALLFGGAYGGLVALQPTLCADYFEGRRRGAVLGVMLTNVALGTLLGPFLAGLAYDMTRSYHLPIALSAAASGCAAMLSLVLEDPILWRRRALGRHIAGQP
jgi:MFS family permease